MQNCDYGWDMMPKNFKPRDKPTYVSKRWSAFQFAIDIFFVSFFLDFILEPTDCSAYRIRYVLKRQADDSWRFCEGEMQSP